ncbi:MAG: glycerol-3-phosphate dehydrogenase/oxidase [Planctomycetes bacterium]|nr:glycerol-3-phosphate dehydrogenase/oxidase [Planctomycetota bacterium]
MNRSKNLEAMVEKPLDLLVIGGGITGAGIALDAAARGLRVGLVERWDFASGTSSKSSKLIHGGLRYLKQLQFKVTLEASREKALLQKLAPHLVRDTEFLFPLYGPLPVRAVVSAGLWIYDLAAGFPKGQIHKKLTPKDALAHLPGLAEERLRGAYVYHDARADDCRLVMHVVKKAADLGALVANRCAVRGFVYDAKRIAGINAFDELDERALTIAAKRVVNATGVWCDMVRAMEDEPVERVVRPSKGVHLVVPRRRVGNREAVILQSPRDGRVVFLIPWGDRTIIGTTDSDYAGDIDRPRAEREDVRYLLELVNEHLPKARLASRDVISTYAGLRPLLVDGSQVPSKASREHHIFESRSGLITITGGKLTTYRRMAREVVDRVAPHAGSSTHRIGLFAASEPPPGVPADMAEHLLRAYGSEAGDVVRRAGASRRLVEGLPYSEAEIEHAVEREMATTITDVLARRTRVLLFDSQRGCAVAERVGQRMARMLGWSGHETRLQVEAYEAEADGS